jgi:hypothetical protein
VSTLDVLYNARQWLWVAFTVGALLTVVGVAVVCGPRLAEWVSRQRRVGRQVPVSDEELMDVGYVAGVVTVGGGR